MHLENEDSASLSSLKIACYMHLFDVSVCIYLLLGGIKAVGSWYFSGVITGSRGSLGPRNV